MEFITDNFKVIALALIALFAGITITLNIKKTKKSNNFIQKGNSIGGDQAGRDINKK